MKKQTTLKILKENKDFYEKEFNNNSSLENEIRYYLSNCQYYQRKFQDAESDIEKLNYESKMQEFWAKYQELFQTRDPCRPLKYYERKV